MMDKPCKCYLLSSNQSGVVKDMFGKELSKKSIILEKVPNCEKNHKRYYLFYYKQNDEIDWWLRYSQPPRILKFERS